jgi:hypothetical protein
MAPTKKKVIWEEIPTKQLYVFRLKVKGGWLVVVNSGVTFYPDPDHEWDGSALP